MTQDKSEAMLEVERRRAEFIAGVSHDLKTPLNGIIGFTSVVLADQAGRNADLEQKLGMVYESARVMLNRINALVDFHRLEAGTKKPEPDWIAPIDMLKESTELHRVAAEKEGLELLLEQTGPTRIHTDMRLLSVALNEVLSNAVRFGRQGQVRVWMESKEQAERTHLCFCVADQGIGFKPEALAKLRRGLRPSDDRDHFEGLGLGLALARLSLEKLGGLIEVESQAGAGATFRLCLNLSSEGIEA